MIRYQFIRKSDSAIILENICERNLHSEIVKSLKTLNLPKRFIERVSICINADSAIMFLDSNGIEVRYEQLIIAT